MRCLVALRALIALGCLCLFGASATGLFAHDQEDAKGIGNSAPAGIGGNGPYDHRNIRLMSRLALSEMGAGQSNVLGSDIWGWTDSDSGREFALFGMSNGTSFVEITDPSAPLYLGKLATHTGNAPWRDIKVYQDHAYVVADGNGKHGLQIFDLSQLLSANPAQPQNFAATAHYSGFDRAHNIAINEESGFAYVVGSEVANSGLVMLDLQNPLSPTLAGTFGADGYTHDTQVVRYQGPDTDYFSSEIAFNSNEDTLTIVDVSDKSSPLQISRTGYSGSEYSHQGWLSEDHRYLFMNDEADEINAGGQTKTRVWNVEDLDQPEYLGIVNGVEQTIDHNLYVKGDLIYQANYTSGLRVLRIDDPQTLQLEEIGFFDTYNTDNSVSFNGAWSVFPFFDSGSIIVSDRQNGLFVLKMNSVPEPLSGCLWLCLSPLALLYRRKRLKG